MNTIKSGTKVHVEFDGTVMGDSCQGTNVMVMDDNGISHQIWYSTTPRHRKFKVTAEPEPAYEPGQVYQDRYGLHFLSAYDGWFVFGSNSTVGFNTPARPLRRLVPASS